MFEIIGEGLLALIKPLLDIFTNEATAPVLAAVAYILLLIFVFWFWHGYVQKPVKRLGSLNAALGEIKAPNTFADAYSFIPNKIEGAEWLKRSWKEFDETTIQPTSSSGSIKITVRPDFYFNREACGLHYSLWQAIPNFMIGIGLVLTFLGLVAALRAATETIGANADDYSSMQVALDGLLKTAGNKFLISIAALSSSIILSIVVNRGLRKLDKAFESVCHEIERLTVFRSIEAVAEDQLSEQRAQAATTKTFMTDVGMQMVDALANKLDAQMAESLRKAIEPLQQSVERLSQGLGQQNTDAMAKLVESFREQLQQGAGDEMQGVAETLRGLRQVLDDTGKNINGQVGDLGLQIQGMANNFSQAAAAIMEHFNKGVIRASEELEDGSREASKRISDEFSSSAAQFAAKLEHAATALSSTLNPLEGRLGTLQNVIDKVGHSVETQVVAFNRVNAETRQTGEAMAGLVASIGQAGRPVEEAARQMRESASMMDGMQQAMTEASTQNRELAERLGQISAELERSWSAYANRFEQVDQQLERVFKEFLDGTRSYQELVNSFNVKLDQSLGNAVKNLGGGIKELGETLEEHSDTLRQLLHLDDEAG